MRASAVVLVVAGAVGCASPAPPPTTVQVRALDDHGRPVPGVIVYGHDPAGLQVARELTDADGQVELELAEGSSITAFDTVSFRPPDLIRDRGYTVLEVAPGDELEIPIESSLTSGRQLTVHLPALPIGAELAIVSAPCTTGYGDETVSIDLDERCPDQGTVVAFATDTFLRPYGYLVASAVDLNQGDFTVPGRWDVTPHVYTVTLAGTDSNGAEIHRSAVVAGQIVHTDRIAATTNAPVTARHSGAGNRTVYRVITRDSTTCLGRTRTYSRSSATESAAFAFDLAELAPLLTDIVVGDHQMSWTGGGAGVRVEARFTASLPTGLARTWTVVAPGDRTQVGFPDIAEFAWPTGLSGDDTITGAGVTVLTSTRRPTYAEVRGHPAVEPLQVEGDFVESTSSATRSCLGP